MMRRAGLGTRRWFGAWRSIERAFFGRWSIVAGCAGGAWLAACGSASAQRWRDYDVLKDAVPAVPRTLRGQQLGTEVEYQALRQWGERWFRWETFGGERSTTDVAGLFAADVEIPCDDGPSPAPSCRRTVSVLHYLAQALDRLDGEAGNLFAGNGGVLGPGYTNDLVLQFPPGTTLAGLPVPERVHTGLDVDAGASWPIGVVPVPAPPEDQALPYLVEPAALGVGAAPPGKLRLGIACALCHYSLDVDKDGEADVRSSRWGQQTPGSPFGPEHTWGIGNQDVHFGWLFALTRNPLMGFTVLSGPVGKNHPEASLEWVRWIKDHYRTEPEAVRREVVRGMLVQPRGYADDTPNALHDPNQIPVLFTLENWPYNFDGSFIDPSDRNNGVWTGAIDFTGLISLASDRSGASQGLLFWEPRGVYSVLSAEQYADMLVDRAPAVLFDPGRRASLKADILGTSDGIPGLLHPDSVVVMRNMLGAVPQPVMARAEELKRVRDPEDYGGDARLRGSMLTLLGTRVITTPGARTDVSLDAVLKSYPKLNADDFQSDVVSLLLDSLTPPPNHTRLLANARTLVPTGYEVFRAEGCASCHMGPYLTDNAMHRLSDWRAEEVGTAAASTAAFRPLGRGQGPALNTAPYRALATRALKLYVAPDFDPETGDPTSEGSVAQGLLGDAVVGYKTLTLRYLWGSTPYLHDGGVVALTFTSTRALAADVEASTSDGNYASGWLRLDADRVGLQLWLGGTPRVGAVDLALNVVASQAYPGVVDPTQSPAYNAALGDDYRAPSVRLELGPALSWGGLLVLPKIGIGYDFERGRMAPLVPQLILIVQAGPLYLESWHQLFLYDLFVDGAQDSYYTRNQLLLALVPKVSVGLELDLTVAVQSSAGDVRSWPFGVVTHVHGRRLHRV